MLVLTSVGAARESISTSLTLRDSVRLRSAVYVPKAIDFYVPKAIDFYVDATSYVFLKGHKLRVEVAGSNTPHYEVNPSAAEITVDAGASSLILPVIPARR